jgi:hemerythrin-like domain-containing protein
MLHEHEQGRALVRAMTGALDAAVAGNTQARQTLHGSALQYIQLLRQHISKEDNILFRMADNVLNPSEQQLLLERFQQAEHRDGRSSVHERYIALAEELCQQAQGLE